MTDIVEESKNIGRWSHRDVLEYAKKLSAEVKRLREIIRGRGYATQVEVDGGVKADWTAQDSVRAGANILVAGTAIFNGQEPVNQSMERMRGCLHGVSPT